MKKLLTLAAGTEVITGLAVITEPSIVTRLLFDENLSGPGQALARLAGCGLLALALACWPVRDAVGSSAPAVWAMLLFSLLSALYLISRAMASAEIGSLLWPAAAFHVVLALLLVRAWRRDRIACEARSSLKRIIASQSKSY